MFAKPNGPNAWGGDFGLWGQRHFSQPRGWSFGDFLNCFTAVRCWYSGDTGMTEDRGKTYRIKKVLDQAVDLLAVPQTWYFYLPSLLWQLLFQDITHFSTSQFHPISQCQGDDSVASDPLSIETCGCTVVPGSLCVAQIWMPEPGPALEGHAIHSNGTMEPQNGSTDEQKKLQTIRQGICTRWYVYGPKKNSKFRLPSFRVYHSLSVWEDNLIFVWKTPLKALGKPQFIWCQIFDQLVQILRHHRAWIKI